MALKLKGVNNVNTTEGVIWKQLLLFALPILFSNFLQQLYSTIDLLIVGNFASASGLAAVGSTGAVTGLLIGLFFGVSIGASVEVSQAYGADDTARVQRTVHTTLFIGLTFGLVLTFVGFFAARPLLQVMNTPAELLDDAAIYMRILFVGMVPMSLYNMSSGILRAVGDSKRPLLFLIIAAVTNLVLDLLFVAVFQWGVAGAAWATVLAQLLSAILSLLTLLRSEESYRVRVREIKPYKEELIGILRIGLPAGMQSIVINLANTIIQSEVNKYGAFAVEGYAASSRIDGFFYMTINSFSLALTTFVGQNAGAKLYGRARKGVKIGVMMGSGLALIMGALLFPFREQALNIFNVQAESMVYGKYMLTLACFGYWVFAFGDILSGAFRGAGKANFPFISSLINMCGIRLLWVFLAQAVNPTVLMVFLAFPVSWACMAIMMLTYYFKGHWLPKEDNPSF